MSETTEQSLPQARGWDIAIKATVVGDDGSNPFDLKVDSPVVVDNLSDSVTVTMRASAARPTLVVFSPEVFTAQLHDTGTLDVVGPACPAWHSFNPPSDCAADPALLMIGTSYDEIVGSKPTGPPIPPTNIQLALGVGALQAGRYHLQEDSGTWRPADQPNVSPRHVSITIDFDVRQQQGAASPSDATSAVAPTSSPAPTMSEACSADNDPLIVAETFVVAAEAGDRATIARCTYPDARLSSDLIAIVASGGWILDQARPVQKSSKLEVGPNGVGFDFPEPPQSRGTFIDSDGHSQSLGPDYQSGVQIAVTLEPDGLWYVTDVLGYASG